MKKIFLICFCSFLALFVSNIPLYAQHEDTKTTIVDRDSLLDAMTNVDEKIKEFIRIDTIGGQAFRQILDSLIYDHSSDIYLLQRDANGLLKLPAPTWTPFDEYITFQDTVIYEPAFLPVVFDGKILPDNLDFLSKDISGEQPGYHLISPDSTFVLDLQRSREIGSLRRYYYTNNPMNVQVNTHLLNRMSDIKNDIKQKSVFEELLSTDEVVTITNPFIEKVIIKHTNWKKEGTHSLQVAQNQISKNWNAGGNSSFNVANYHKVELKFKKNKLTWDNSLEWKLVLQKTPSDTLHSVNITEDYFRVYSVFGVEAYKKWSYSANLDVRTPLLNGFNVNSPKKLRSFFSPLDVNVGIGLRYQLEHVSPKDKYKKFNLAFDLSPLSVKYIYINDTTVINDETSYGVKSGKNSKFDVGSNINANLSYSLNRYTKFDSRLRYFTNYENVLFESENRFSFALNRYFSASIDLYVRFDDSVDRKEKYNKTLGYFQYNEVVRFGLSYTW